MQIDLEVVEQLVRDAATDELLPRFTLVESSQKTDGSVVTEADLAMQNRLLNELSAQFPDSIVLSEEMTVEQQQAVLDADKPVWCLDPLDGTSNYANGIPYFAVSISLIYQARVILGLVYDPVRDECFKADENHGALLNDKPLLLQSSQTELSRATAIIDFKRLDAALSTRLVSQQPFASQRNFGASALDWCWLAAARGHVYLHGKQNLWDYSAGQFIFEKAGGLCCTLNGDDIFSNKLETRSVVAAVNQSLMDSWKKWIGIQA